MKKFTSLPQMLRLDIGPAVANYLVLAQMPLKLVGHQVGLNLRSFGVLPWHLSPRALFRYEVHHELVIMQLVLHVKTYRLYAWCWEDT